MNFKEYFLLTEGGYKESRTANISEDTFKILYNTHCKNYKPEGMKLYRSMRHLYSDERYNLVDPRYSERYATDTASYIMWFIESLPEWKKYPPRSRSIIAASTFGNASGYHGSKNVSRVIPFDNTKLGICKNSDFWGAFEILDVTAANHIIQHLIDFFYKGVKKIPTSTYTGSTKNSFNREQFLNFINSVDFKLFDDPSAKSKFVDKLGDPRYGAKKLHGIFHPLEPNKNMESVSPTFSGDTEKKEWESELERSKKFKSKDAFSILANMKKEANPEKNGFICITHEEYNKDIKEDSKFQNDREIWFSNRALLIRDFDNDYDREQITTKYLQEIRNK